VCVCVCVCACVHVLGDILPLVFIPHNTVPCVGEVGERGLSPQIAFDFARIYIGYLRDVIIIIIIIIIIIYKA